MFGYTLFWNGIKDLTENGFSTREAANKDASDFILDLEFLSDGTKWTFEIFEEEEK